MSTRKYKPSMHEDFDVGLRVVVGREVHPGLLTGTIAGIASMHVMFTYIVLLDTPIPMDGETWSAITVSGCSLRRL